MLYFKLPQHPIKFAFLLLTSILAPRVADANYLGERFGVLSSPQIFSKSLLWYLSQEPPLTQRCRNELTDFANNLRGDHQWALNMYDANGKLSAGLLEGNFVELGSFDECLRIARTKNHGLTGKYCLGSLYVPSLYVNNATTRIMHAGVKVNETDFAICFPSSCPATGLQTVMKGIGLNLTVTENRCQTKATQYKITAGSYVTLTLACIILLLIVISTIYDFACEEKPHWALHSFSLRANGRQIFANTNPSANDIRSFYGLRTIAMTMIIVTHVFSYRIGGLTRNTYYYSYWIHQVKNGPIIPTVNAVDIFLMLSGCLVSYNFLQKCLKGQVFSVLPYYIERYLRLTPALLAVFLFAITWYESVGSGPLWFLTAQIIQPCLTHWWSYLLYIQNYFPTSMCLAPTWYLSLDFQLYILSPILLLPLKRWAKETLVVTAGLALLSMAATFTLSLVLNMCASNECGNEPSFFTYYYYFLPTKASSWLIGFLLGSLIFKVKTEEIAIMEKKWAILLLVAAIVVYVATTFGECHVVISERDRLENAFSLALLRPTMLLSVACIVYICEIGHGGIVTSFLSNPVFVVVSRLSFSVYLVHNLVVQYNLNSIRVAPYVSNYTLLVNDFAGMLLLSLLLGLLLTMTVELPAQHYIRALISLSKNKSK